MPKHRPPSRLRYEAEHPTLTARVPAEVKTKLQTALAAEGLTFSEWVQAQVAGHTGELSDAFEKGRAAGRKEGEAGGYRRGKADGEQVAGLAGFRAGLLAYAFAAERGRSYDAGVVARRLIEQPEQRSVAERLLPADHKQDWARLVRQVASVR